ncbi:hypothetical protein GCM10010994_29130 [Chelatococcus reniformis]|uniref:Uncharacterized protein n=1 Tax=Chelatococcus reniformis TaxID=1494448 RepID=A0A916UCK0_9HYPH|nr:hypothetical protein GCM10010994_29130 [Chelatococcus reniformis]
MSDSEQSQDELGTWFVIRGDSFATGGLVALRLHLVEPSAEQERSAVATERSLALFLPRERAAAIARSILSATADLPAAGPRAH